MHYEEVYVSRLVVVMYKSYIRFMLEELQAILASKKRRIFGCLGNQTSILLSCRLPSGSLTSVFLV